MQFTVYLIHLDSPIEHAQHYIGFTCNLEQRLAQHRSGCGARLLAEANRRGIEYRIVRTWKGGQWVNDARALERKLKKQKNAPRLCPVCNDTAKNFF